LTASYPAHGAELYIRARPGVSGSQGRTGGATASGLLIGSYPAHGAYARACPGVKFSHGRTGGATPSGLLDAGS